MFEGEHHIARAGIGPFAWMEKIPSLDPYSMLGLGKNSERKVKRSTYHRMTRRQHEHRFLESKRKTPLADLPNGLRIANATNVPGRLTDTYLKNSANTDLDQYSYTYSAGHPWRRERQTRLAGWPKGPLVFLVTGWKLSERL